MAQITVQVVLYKGSEYLPKLIHSLNVQTFTDVDILFWENSVNDQEYQNVEVLLKALKRPYTLIKSSENTGFSAHNELYRRHESPFVFLLNQDAYLDSRCLEFLLQRMNSDTRFGSIGPLVMRWKEHGDEEVDTSGLVYHALGKVVDRKEKDGGPVWGISGAAVLYRRAALEAIRKDGNIFDPRFFMYKEDVETAFRLQQSLFSSWCEEQALVHHIRAIKDVPGGIMGRIHEERKRPEKLRLMTYVNQWRIYRMHWHSIRFLDKLVTMGYEFLRTMLFIFISPKLWLEAVSMLKKDTYEST